jgi:hypothetical protein
MDMTNLIAAFRSFAKAPKNNILRGIYVKVVMPSRGIILALAARNIVESQKKNPSE